MFKKAIKSEAKLRLAIAGPSGSGKTYTALAVATALGGKVAMIDTEHGSASKYADLFDFDVMEMAAPFHPDRFSEAIQEAAAAGYNVVILDSLSHAWNGSGGALELVEQFSRKYKGNSYAAWGDVTPIQNRLIESIIGANAHIIGTMRSKQDYILTERNGKQVPQKVGMAPIQRDGLEYEFDVVLDMDIENNGIVQKTRCPALTGKIINKPGNDLAGTLKDWLGGAPALTENDYFSNAMMAQSGNEWAENAYRIGYVRNAFENSQRLLDWRLYLTRNDYSITENGAIAQVLKDYCSRVADGVLIKEAAQLALSDYKLAFDLTGGVEE